MVFGETCGCWLPVGQVCKCCKFAGECQAGPAGWYGVHEGAKESQDPGRGTRQTEILCQYSRDLQMCMCS